MQQFSLPLAPDLKAIPGERLAGGDAPQIEREIGDTRQTAGFFVEMGDLEQPALRLMPGMFTGDTVEPAFDTTGQAEIGRVDGQDQRAVNDAAIEPVRQNALHALDTTVAGRPFLPFVDPGELVPAPMLAVTDGGADHGRLQPGERGLEQPVFPSTRGTPNGRQKLVWSEAQKAGRPEAAILRFDNLAGSPDQHVSIPDRGHAVLGPAVDLDTLAAGLVKDRRDPLYLGEREERPLHQVALIAGTGIAARDHEGIEAQPLALPPLLAALRHDAGHSEGCLLGRGQWTGRKDTAGCLVGGGPADAVLSPSLEVVEGINDPAANLAIGWTGAIGAMLFQCTDGNAEEARRIGRAQETGRQPRLGIEHDRTSGWVRRLSATTAGHGEPWRRIGGLESAGIRWD